MRNVQKFMDPSYRDLKVGGPPRMWTDAYVPVSEFLSLYSDYNVTRDKLSKALKTYEITSTFTGGRYLMNLQAAHDWVVANCGASGLPNVAPIRNALLGHGSTFTKSESLELVQGLPRLLRTASVCAATGISLPTILKRIAVEGLFALKTSPSKRGTLLLSRALLQRVLTASAPEVDPQELPTDSVESVLEGAPTSRFSVDAGRRLMGTAWDQFVIPELDPSAHRRTTVYRDDLVQLLQRWQQNAIDYHGVKLDIS